MAGTDNKFAPGHAAVWVHDASLPNRQPVEYNSKTLSGSHVSDYIRDNSNSDRVTVFLVPSDERPAFQHSSVADSIRGAHKAVVMPYVYHGENQKVSTLDLVRPADKGLKHMSLDQLHTHLSDAKASHEGTYQVKLQGHESELHALQNIVRDSIKGIRSIRDAAIAPRRVSSHPCVDS
jgi:hypothetical protein